MLLRPRFGATRAHVRLWLDAFLRVSRQVFPEVIPGGEPAAVGGDLGDLPVLNTAYAAAAGDVEAREALNILTHAIKGLPYEEHPPRLNVIFKENIPDV